MAYLLHRRDRRGKEFGPVAAEIMHAPSAHFSVFHRRLVFPGNEFGNGFLQLQYGKKDAGLIVLFKNRAVLGIKRRDLIGKVCAEKLPSPPSLHPGTGLKCSGSAPQRIPVRLPASSESALAQSWAVTFSCIRASNCSTWCSTQENTSA